MKKTLVISVIINILFILFGGYVIHKKGGLDYLKQNSAKLSEIQQDYNLYYKTKRSIFEIMPNDTNKIIFLGNSITNFCDWRELFGNENIINRGINGDVINGVIDRLDGILSSNPKKIFLMIGTNDLAERNTIVEILSNYERLLALIKEKSPRTRLYVQSILPTFNDQRRNNDDIIAINKGLIDSTEKYDFTYVNLFDLLKTERNELDTVYSFDGLHLNGKGYLIWKKAIEQYVNN
ncbi:MAG: GDSL-type esterase/lipase family protein [Candidatus Kapaibacterium sp.]